MGWTPLSAAINIFPPTQKFFSMYVDVVFPLLFSAHLVNTLYALAHRSRSFHSPDGCLVWIMREIFLLKRHKS
jgi:hypothetical protein